MSPKVNTVQVTSTIAIVNFLIWLSVVVVVLNLNHGPPTPGSRTLPVGPVEELLENPSDEQLDRLLSYTTSNDSYTRHLAIAGLAYYVDKRAIIHLIKILDDENRISANYASIALMRIGKPVEQFILRNLDLLRTNQGKLLAFRVLRNGIGGESSQEVLWQLIQSPQVNDQVRAEAVRTISLINEDKGSEIIVSEFGKLIQPQMPQYYEAKGCKSRKALLEALARLPANVETANLALTYGQRVFFNVWEMIYLQEYLRRGAEENEVISNSLHEILIESLRELTKGDLQNDQKEHLWDLFGLIGATCDSRALAWLDSFENSRDSIIKERALDASENIEYRTRLHQVVFMTPESSLRQRYLDLTVMLRIEPISETLPEVDFKRKVYNQLSGYYRHKLRWQIIEHLSRH